eukprot:CAMPEP_0114539950 /NCGR_PEP_ID=MMETSP0114-20121206/509_1 /TAXON_ID=31324 /ORGANISM="Goniomonas sp, Strain m" /LENGTH=177 /DNA_ID=CAMNT_0001724083 /DNA_START=17 /DNA_END=547 /DNA_ORIENTATION=-
MVSSSSLEEGQGPGPGLRSVSPQSPEMRWAIAFLAVSAVIFVSTLTYVASSGESTVLKGDDRYYYPITGVVSHRSDLPRGGPVGNKTTDADPIIKWYDAQLKTMTSKVAAYLKTVNTTNLAQQTAVKKAVSSSVKLQSKATDEFAKGVETVYTTDMPGVEKGYQGLAKDADHDDLKW